MSSNEVWPFVPKYEKTCQLSSEIKTSFDRKIGVYLLMYVEETQFIFLRCILYGIEFSKPLFRQCHMYMRLFFFKTCPLVGIFFRPRILSNLKMSPNLKYSQLPCSKPI